MNITHHCPHHNPCAFSTDRAARSFNLDVTRFLNVIHLFVISPSSHPGNPDQLLLVTSEDLFPRQATKASQFVCLLFVGALYCFHN